ncbi:MAG TPA: hypothetical protein VEW48_01420 [Thermoanaerobaculia bacterium]|nr:hypothetical protein [Thermoanaerobaculia bacterium]
MLNRGHALIALLVLFTAGTACSPAPTLPENLVPGRAVTRTVWKKDLHFLFEGKAGEVIALRVTSKASGLDPHVSLIDPEDAEEASDDDSGEHGNSLIKDHILKRTGEYTVIVGSDGKAQGKVEILLEKAKPPS